MERGLFVNCEVFCNIKYSVPSEVAFSVCLIFSIRRFTELTDNFKDSYFSCKLSYRLNPYKLFVQSFSSVLNLNMDLRVPHDARGKLLLVELFVILSLYYFVFK